MPFIQISPIENHDVFAETVFRSGKYLGLSKMEIGKIIGIDDFTDTYDSIDPSTKTGELATLFIRCYRNLLQLVGSREDDLKRWMYTKNNFTGGIPSEQIQTVTGLLRILDYLDTVSREDVLDLLSDIIFGKVSMPCDKLLFAQYIQIFR